MSESKIVELGESKNEPIDSSDAMAQCLFQMCVQMSNVTTLLMAQVSALRSIENTVFTVLGNPKVGKALDAVAEGLGAKKNEDEGDTMGWGSDGIWGGSENEPQ